MNFEHKIEEYCLLCYVEDCSVKLKKFKNISSMRSFITKFKKKYPDTDQTGDSWINFYVTNITGVVRVYEESGMDAP